MTHGNAGAIPDGKLIKYKMLSNAEDPLKKNLVAMLFLVTVSGVTYPPSANGTPTCVLPKAAQEAAAAITGLFFKATVPCVAQGTREIRDYVQYLVNDRVPKGKIAGEEEVYKALGFIPAQFNYAEQLVELYSSELAGCYDPEKKKFIAADWVPTAMQPELVVHELTHALQDQHFNLNKFVFSDYSSSDRQLARMALVEGEATVVAEDFAARQAGEPTVRERASAESISRRFDVGGSVDPQKARIPESLRRLMVFPYVSGVTFVHNLLQRGGYEAVHSAFQNPPQSTTEILHPTDYGKTTHSFTLVQESELLKEAEIKNGTVAYSDTLGEFGVVALLSGVLTDGAEVGRAAEGWSGDRVAVIRGKKTSERLVLWITRWETEKDGEEFESAYRKFLRILDENPHGHGSILLVPRVVTRRLREVVVRVPSARPDHTLARRKLPLPKT